MSALEKSLLCLRHPVTLLSIGLLLINDHVLKIVAPSWITGKLSDLAGLFFFPFVLMAVLGLVLDRLQVPPRRTSVIAFTITAVWFLLIKLVHPVNAATEELLSHLLNVPVQIILDPSDLIALPVLIPAWRLWETVKQISSNHLGWFALGIASLATLATSPLPPVPIVQRVGSHDGALYASGYYLPLAKSADGGKTWVSDAASPAETNVRPLPVVICDSPQTKVCYRTSQNEQVDGSDDGGQTWRVAWSIPEGRREFMERLREARCPVLISCGELKKLDIGPYDLTFSTPVGQNGLHTLVVAMGNEGIMVRTPEGKWERYAVLGARPTPMAASNPDDALMPLLKEIKIGVLGMWLVLVGLTLYGAKVILRADEWSPAEYEFPWVARPTFALIAVTFLAYVGLYVAGCVALRSLMDLDLYMGVLFLLAWPVGVVPLCLIVLGVGATWLRVGQVIKQPRIIVGFGICIVGAVGSFAVGIGSLVVWTVGILPFYWLALIVSVGSAICVVYFGMKELQKLARLAVTPSASG